MDRTKRGQMSQEQLEQSKLLVFCSAMMQNAICAAEKSILIQSHSTGVQLASILCINSVTTGQKPAEMISPFCYSVSLSKHLTSLRIEFRKLVTENPPESSTSPALKLKYQILCVISFLRKINWMFSLHPLRATLKVCAN